MTQAQYREFAIVGLKQQLAEFKAKVEELTGLLQELTASTPFRFVLPEHLGVLRRNAAKARAAKQAKQDEVA